MSVIAEPIVRRWPLAVEEAYSGARLERVELADGRHLVLKHLAPDGDWLTRATRAPDRLEQLWHRGVLRRLEAVIDHTILDVVAEDDHTIVVMRDVSAELLGSSGPVTRATSRQTLAGLAALHEAGRTEPVFELCSIGARYGMFARAVHAADTGPGAHPSRAFIVAGWDRFAEMVDPDVAAAIAAVHRQPHVLGDQLATRASTLVHGDAKLPNLGLASGRLVVIDWGELTGFGPPEIDVAWYAIMNELRVGHPDLTFADYEAVSSHPLDREALDLACIGSLAQMGFKLARACTDADRPEVRADAENRLAWWTTRVRVALERTDVG